MTGGKAFTTHGEWTGGGEARGDKQEESWDQPRSRGTEERNHVI